jgi:hypothetical protein
LAKTVNGSSNAPTISLSYMANKSPDSYPTHVPDSMIPLSNLGSCSRALAPDRFKHRQRIYNIPVHVLVIHAI